MEDARTCGQGINGEGLAENRRTQGGVNMEQIITDIRAGLRVLGYKAGSFTLHRFTSDRFSVGVGGERVGIWDSLKRTFID